MKRLLGAAAAAITLAACSSQPGQLSASAERVLVPKVQAVRDAASTGSFSRLQSAVASLKRAVARQVKANQVSSSRAAAIDDAADKLLLDATPTSTPTPSPTPSSPTPTQTTPSATPTTQSPTPTQSSSSTTSPSSSPSTTISVGGIPLG